ncbi:hypothetical protein ACC791_37575, partial [Rhizobium ruizarguesonis]
MTLHSAKGLEFDTV